MAFVRNNNNNRRHNNNYNNNRHRHPNSNPNNNPNANGQRRHVNRVNQVFESNGPDGRIRGTAQQIVEKYATLARDAQMSGDKVLSMNYLQHAEHYQRLQNEITEENAVFEREREAQRQQQQAQPEISAGDAADGFVNPERLHQAAVEVEGEQRIQRQAERSAERPQQERGPRPQRTSRPPRQQDDEVDDNELPSFLQVPITSGQPDAETPRPTRVARPRRVAPSAPDAEDTAE